MFGTVPVHLPVSVSLALLALGLYLLHTFSWMLGAFYRSGHSDFPWMFQRHVSTRKIERRKVRYGKPIPVEAVDPDAPAPPPPVPPKLHVKPIQE